MKATHSLPVFFLWAVGLLFTVGCTSVQELVDSGNYEETIERAQRRLTGQQKKNPKFVAALEEAVNRANERDVQRADYLRNNGATDWTRVHALYHNIKQRQDALRPLLPLVDKNGRQAVFRLVRVEPLVVESADRAAAQLYNRAIDYLEGGRQGDKAAARQAYSQFERVDRYRPNYRDSYQLAAEAEQLGKIYVAVEVANESGSYLPAGFEQELLRVRTTNMDDQWRIYDFQRRSDRAYDYRARMVIRNIQVSPERIVERNYLDEKEIIDGEEYVLDSNGNVAKDSLGNDLTQPRRVIIRAEVIEVLQTKSALVSGHLQLYDLRRERMVDEEDLSAEAIFENYASTYRGDRRALSQQSRRRIGNQPQNFPTDEQLILEAAEVLKPQLQQRLAASYRLI